MSIKSRQNSFAKSANPCTLAVKRTIEAHRDCARAVVFYILSLAFICFFLAFDFGSSSRVYMAGDVADTDVVADRYMLVEDTTATEARRRQVMLSQPPVYDFSMEPYIFFEQRLIALMREYNGAPARENQMQPSASFAADIGQE
ncbi:MAG: HD family phosphohydrolase, partial [Candidatus Desulfovibrio faecigallinarum]|nr:HD family phosphohydrolase [Candidatus Desulfovibrio faecigallinarum]